MYVCRCGSYMSPSEISNLIYSKLKSVCHVFACVVNVC